MEHKDTAGECVPLPTAIWEIALRSLRDYEGILWARPQATIEPLIIQDGLLSSKSMLPDASSPAFMTQSRTVTKQILNAF